VKISAIAGDIPGGCPYGQAGYGYWEATQYTEGEFLSICDDVTSSLSLLAEKSIITDMSFSPYILSAEPVENTLAVEINNTPTNEWDYLFPSIKITSPNLVVGDDIRVVYKTCQ